MRHIAWLTWILFAVIQPNGVVSQNNLQSPCPQIFTYESSTTERDKWYATVKIKPEVTLYGFWIDIILDREAESLGNWIGDVSTPDNLEYKIENKKRILNAFSTTSVRFFVKYNVRMPAPKIKYLRLNGQQICSAGGNNNNNDDDSSRPNRGNDNSWNTNSNSDKRNSTPTSHIEALSVNGNNNGDWNNPSKPLSASDDNNDYNNGRNRYTPNPNSNQGSSSRNTDSYNNNYNNNNSNKRTDSTYTDTTSQSTRNPYSWNNSQSSRTTTTERYDPYSNNNRNDDRGTNQRDVSTNTATTKIIYPSQNSNSNWQSNKNTNSNSNFNNDDSDSGGRIKPIIQPQGFNNYGSSDTNKPTRTTTPKYQHADNSNDYDYDSYHSSSKAKPTSNDYFQGDLNWSSGSKITPTPLPRRGNEENKDNECGKVAVQPRPLIVGGQPTSEGQWPWHVAIYHTQTVESSKYICGGSLISTSHVLTAAHCVTLRSSSQKVDPRTLTVYLGKYNLRKSSDSVQIMVVKKIFIHPQYNASNFYADMAILKFNKPCEYTTYVRPVCLWKDNEKELSNIIDKEGTVVGWGFDQEGRVTEELTLVRMPIVKQSTCLWSFKEFYTHFTSEQSFCAGFENGTSVCNGDSGGGMVFPETNRDRSTTWRIRGLVSIGVAKQYEYKCDPYHYVVFTDVAQFTTWIREKLLQ